MLDHMLEVPDFPPTIKTVLWENLHSDKVRRDLYIIDAVKTASLQHVFVASDSEFISTYTFYSSTVNGKGCMHII